MTAYCYVNGERRELGAAATIADLVADLGLSGKKIAVERNGEVVARSSHAGTPLSAEDRIEIVVAVGGG